MSLPDDSSATRGARAPRRARAKISLKMQAIAYLSRREHSRQELRAKLLDSLRKRAREEAAMAAAEELVASELARARAESRSNGIDAAFGPPAGDPASAPLVPARRPVRGGSAGSAGRAAAPSGDTACIAGADEDAEQPDPEFQVDQLLDWLVANKYLSETSFVEGRVHARSAKQGAMLIKHELARHGLALASEQAAALRETEFARALALWQRKFGALAADARERARQARFLAARGFAADVVRRIVGGEDEG